MNVNNLNIKTMYTKQQRNEIYKKALAFIEANYNEINFLCHTLKFYSVDFHINKFPEILKHEPANIPQNLKNSFGWFPTSGLCHNDYRLSRDEASTKRIEILKQAIAETE